MFSIFTRWFPFWSTSSKVALWPAQGDTAASAPSNPLPPTVAPSRVDSGIVSCTEDIILPTKQQQLQLHAIKQPYELCHSQIHSLHHDGEVLIEVFYIGLNPVDWKSV